MKSQENYRFNLGSLSETLKAWGIRVAVVLMAILWLTLMASTWADAAEVDRSPAAAASSASPQPDDEYGFNWLDPEKKIYILQNRRYLKANRMLLSLMAGPGISNSYRTVFSVEPRLAYYFREDLGFEVFYAKAFNSQNTTFTQLVSTYPSIVPVVREIESELGAVVHWVPWYSKINVFNKILYFDWYFSGGAGSIGSTSTTSTAITKQDLFSFFAGTGHQYHLTSVTTVRLDFMGAFYRAPTNGATGDQQWFSDYRFAIGIGWRI